MSASAYVEDIFAEEEEVEVYGDAEGNAVGSQQDMSAGDESDDREYVGDVDAEDIQAAQQEASNRDFTHEEVRELFQMMANEGVLDDDELDDDEDEELDEEGPQGTSAGPASQGTAQGGSAGAPGPNSEVTGGRGMYMGDEQQQQLLQMLMGGGGMMGGMQGEFERMMMQQEAARRERMAPPAGAPAPPKAEWKGLSTLPEATQQAYFEALQQLLAVGRRQLTVLVIGCSGAGKSATINSILGEPAIDLKPLMDTPPKVVAATRTAQGVTLRLLDMPPLADGDKVSQRALDTLASLARTEGQIDVVVYVDRLDGERVGPLTKQVLSGVTDALGKDVWNHTILALTRGEALPVTGGQAAYEAFCDRRAAALRKAMYDNGAPKSAAIPLVLIDNRSGCPKDDSGQKVLPDGRCWLPMLVHEMVQIALDNESPYVYDPKLRGTNNPNRKFKWLIPLVIVAQFLFKVYVLDRILDEDSITGDAYGPYSPEYIEDERARRKEEAAAKKRAAAKKAAKKAEKKASKPIVVIEDDLIAEDDSSSSSDSDDDLDVGSDDE